MQISDSYVRLPMYIIDLIKEANLFYSEEYEANVRFRGQKQIYVWDKFFILVARVKQVAFVKGAVLETEPYMLEFGGDEKEFLTDAMEELSKQGIHWVESNVTARFQTYPRGASVVPCGNFILDLQLTEEELFSNIHSKHRNSIRRGEKAGLELRMGHSELIDDYAKLAIETYRRSNKHDEGAPYYRRLTQGLENESLYFLIYKDGVAQAGAQFYFNKRIAYYLHGATIDHPETGAANYLMWRAILFFKEMGVRELSLVGYRYNPDKGSKLEGIQRFKERFGGVLEQSYMFKCVNNNFIYKLYKIVIQIMRGKPFMVYKDAIDEQKERYPELNGEASV